MSNYFEYLAIEPTLNYERIKDAVDKRLAVANQEEAQQIKEICDSILENTEQRYEYYFSVKGKQSYEPSRLTALVADNNVEEIKAIVWMLKKTKGERWSDGSDYVVEGAVRDAILQGNDSLVSFFLDEGVSASSWAYNQGSSGGLSHLIHFAATTGNLAIVKMLVQKGAVIKRRDNYFGRGDDTAIIAAVRGGHSDVVDYLLSKGAGADVSCNSDVYTNTADFRFKPLLLVAAEHHENKQIIASMVHYGADVGAAIRVAAIVYQKVMQQGQERLSTTFRMEKRPQDPYFMEDFDKRRADFVSRIDYLEKNYPRMISNLLDHAIAKDLSQGSGIEYGLEIFSGLDISSFNFIGVSIGGIPITHEMLRDAKLKGWDKALVTLADLYRLGDSDSQRMSELQARIEVAIQKNGSRIGASGVINLVPLWQSAQLGDVDTVNARLAAGISPNESPGDKSPLVLAAEHGHLAVVKALIQAKGIDKKSIVTAIDAAKAAKHSAIEAYLCENQDVDNGDEEGNTLLHKAAAAGDVARVRELIAKGADIDKTNNNGETALGIAAKNSRHEYQSSSNLEQLEVMRTLLELGANPNIYKRYSPLYVAVIAGSVEAVAMLLPVTDKKDEVTTNSLLKDVVSPWYVSLMFKAVWQEESGKILELLHRYGADFNRKSGYGNNLLCDAVRHLPSGSGISSAMRGLSASVFGVEDRVKPGAMDKALEQLIQKSRDSFDAAFLNILFLVEHGADITLTDKEGNTPLHLLIEKIDLSHLEEVYERVLQLFIDKGARVNVVNKNGVTPLHAAAHKGDITAIEFLLRHGADINATDGDKRTALHIAASYGYASTCERLLQLGANKNALNKDGLTPSALCEYWQMKSKESYTFSSVRAEKEFEQKYIDTRNIIKVTTAANKAVSELVRQRQSIHDAASKQEKDNGFDSNLSDDEPGQVLYV